MAMRDGEESTAPFDRIALMGPEDLRAHHDTRSTAGRRLSPSSARF